MRPLAPDLDAAAGPDRSSVNRRRAVAATGLVLATLTGRVGANPAEQGAASALNLKVGPSREIKTLAEAARIAAGRTSIEVDAGTYHGDVAVWDGLDLTLRAVGGRVQLRAGGASAEGKGIWVVRGSRMQIQGFDFFDAKVNDANGAGIRFESGHLSVRDCSFGGNQNGILTGNDGEAALEIEDCEFAYNGHGDGQSHNLYVGSIASLRVQGSWFHHAHVGHLLKSRAGRNLVLYNRLADGRDGHASYELEFPSGGVAIVIGNLIQQAQGTGNPHIVSFGVEGYRWPSNELYLVNNTIIDERASGGVPLRVSSGASVVRVLNNLLLGGATELQAAGVGEFAGNHRATAADFEVAGGASHRLDPRSRLVGRAVNPGSAHGQPLLPTLEHAAPRGTRARRTGRLSPGAFAPAPANPTPP